MQSLSTIIRRLARQPIFSLSVLALLTLAVAAVAAIVSFADALLGRPVPAVEVDRLVRIAPNSLSAPDATDLGGQLESIEGFTPWIPVQLALATDTGARTVRAGLVGDDFFDALELRPLAGRWPDPSSDTGNGGDADALTVVLGASLADRLFGGAAESIGSILRLGGEPATVVGVAPQGFRGLALESPDQLWVPLRHQARVQPATAPFRLLERREVRWLGGVGRLAPDASLEQARAELATLQAGLDEAFPGGPPRAAVLEPLAEATIPPSVRQTVRSTVAVLGGAVAFLMLAVLANLTLLVLARIERSRGEMAVRLAQGGSRWRVVAPFLTEGLVLTLAGTALGLWIAELVLQSLASIGVSRAITVSLAGGVGGDVVLQAGAVALLLLGGLGLGLLVRVRRIDVATALRGERPVLLGRGRWLGMNGLLAGQIALAFLLVVGALVLARDVEQRLASSVGPPTADLHLAEVDLSLLPLDRAAQGRLRAEIQRRLENRPEIEHAGWTSAPPLGAARLVSRVGPPGGPVDISAATTTVDGSALAALGLAVEGDSRFAQASPATDPVPPGGPRRVLVNRTLEGMLWPHRSALGHSLSLEGPFGPESLLVVGLVEDAPLQDLDPAREPQIYLAAAGSADVPRTLLVRAASFVEPETLSAVIREEITAASADAPLDDLRTMEIQRRRVLAGPLLLTRLVGLFGAWAALLAAVGLYGVFSWSVAARRREIGVRLALGGDSGTIYRWVVGRALMLTGCGLLAGGGLSWLALETTDRWLPALALPELSPLGPEVLVTAFGLVLVTLVATLPAARRAARTDPAIVLRAE